MLQRLAAEKFTTQNYIEAIAICDEFLLKSPDDAQMLSIRAMSLENEKYLIEAIADYEKSIELRADGNLSGLCGLALFKLGKNKRAKFHIENAVKAGFTNYAIVLMGLSRNVDDESMAKYAKEKGLFKIRDIKPSYYSHKVPNEQLIAGLLNNLQIVENLSNDYPESKELKERYEGLKLFYETEKSKYQNEIRDKIEKKDILKSQKKVSLTNFLSKWKHLVAIFLCTVFFLAWIFLASFFETSPSIPLISLIVTCRIIIYVWDFVTDVNFPMKISNLVFGKKEFPDSNIKGYLPSKVVKEQIENTNKPSFAKKYFSNLKIPILKLTMILITLCYILGFYTTREISTVEDAFACIANFEHPNACPTTSYSFSEYEELLSSFPKTEDGLRAKQVFITQTYKRVFYEGDEKYKMFEYILFTCFAFWVYIIYSFRNIFSKN